MLPGRGSASSSSARRRSASPAQMAEAFLLEIYVHGIDGQSDAATSASPTPSALRTPSPNRGTRKTMTPSRHS